MVVLLLLSSVVHSQESKKIDSILAKANLMVYENPDAAIKSVSEVSQQFKLNTRQQTDALLTIASAYSTKRYNQKAIDYGLQAYRLAEAGNAEREQVRVLGFIGNQYYFLKMHDKVNLYLDMAEQIMNSKIDKDSLHFIKGNVYFVKGVNYKDKLDCDVAISYFDKSIAEHSKATDNKSSSLNLSIAMIQKGLCLTDLLRLTEARLVLEKAHDIAQKNSHKENEYYADIALAKTFYAENNFKESNEILFRIRKEIDEFNALSLQNDFYSALADNFLKLKDYENYNIYSLKYLKVKNEIDSLEVNSFNNLINEISLDSRSTLETQKRDESVYYIIAFVVFLSLLGFIVFKTTRIRKSLQ